MPDTEKKPSICRVRQVTALERRQLVAGNVQANYFVECLICPSRWGLASFLGGYGPVVWVTDHYTAVLWADAHVTLHLDQQCDSCGHMPVVDVTQADTTALLIARRNL